MKKAIPSFVIGLIFSLIGAVCAYLFWVIFVLVSVFSNQLIKTILTIFPFINLATFIISFIGSFICIKKPKVGGIILIISSIISLICFIVICLAIKTIDIKLILFWVPTVFIMSSGLLALKCSN